LAHDAIQIVAEVPILNVQPSRTQELAEIVLASVSPRRRELLTSLGLRVIVIPSNVVEGNPSGYAPLDLATFHAGAKVDAVAAREPGRVILAADTVVDLDGTALGKPSDQAGAVRMLTALAGREHVVHTAYALVDGPSGRRTAETVSTRVRFYPLDRAAIEAYAATGDPLDKAGAYGIQGRGAALVERIDGDFYTVMGLPLGRVVRALSEFGYSLPNAVPSR
jgi:septum formation protein